MVPELYALRYSQSSVSRNNIPLKEIQVGRGPVTTVGVDVQNTGSVTGTEVVQLYLRNTAASVEQPVCELKGFTRVTLAPGEKSISSFHWDSTS